MLRWILPVALLVGATVAFVSWPDGHALAPLAIKQTRNALGVGVVVGGLLAVAVTEQRRSRLAGALLLALLAFAVSGAMPVAALVFAVLVASSQQEQRHRSLHLVTAGAIMLVSAATLVPRTPERVPIDPVVASAEFIREGNLYRALDAARAAAARDGTVPDVGHLQLARVAAEMGDVEDARRLAMKVAEGAALPSSREAAAMLLAELP